MRYKIFKDGECVNTIVADEAFCKEYCENNGFTYEADPLPEIEPVAEPTEADDTAAMLVDHEYRLTLLELGFTE